MTQDWYITIRVYNRHGELACTTWATKESEQAAREFIANQAAHYGRQGCTVRATLSAEWR